MAQKYAKDIVSLPLFLNGFSVTLSVLGSKSNEVLKPIREGRLARCVRTILSDLLESILRQISPLNL